MRNYDSRKRILVTGGAGFLGSHLCDRLLGQGHEVLCVDNLFTGTKRNIDHLHDNPRFEFVRHEGDAFVAFMATPAEFTGRAIWANRSSFASSSWRRKFIVITGSRSNIVRKPMPADDPAQRHPDIALARKKFGATWEPRVQLELGLTKTIEYFGALLGRGA